MNYSNFSVDSQAVRGNNTATENVATFEVVRPRLKLFQEILRCLNVKRLLDGLAAIMFRVK